MIITVIVVVDVISIYVSIFLYFRSIETTKTGQSQFLSTDLTEGCYCPALGSSSGRGFWASFQTASDQSEGRVCLIEKKSNQQIIYPIRDLFFTFSRSRQLFYPITNLFTLSKNVDYY